MTEDDVIYKLCPNYCHIDSYYDPTIHFHNIGKTFKKIKNINDLSNTTKSTYYLLLCNFGVFFPTSLYFVTF